MARSHDFGRRCEDAAAAALTCNGWIVRCRNFRDGPREIDLVAQRGQTIAFVEVKGRTSDRHHDPLATVDWRKRRDLARAARAWIAQYGRPGECYRFDAVSVIGATAAGARLEHLEDAWRLG